MKIFSSPIIKRAFFYLTLISFFCLNIASHIPEEGMYPLSEVPNLDLKKAGLKIDIDEIYNPNGISLVDALVRVGGCTGSFVSDEGLIITNHHCAFGYVQRASTVENNYVENGFLAGSFEKEIPAKGLTCMITQSYEDVSSLILEAANAVDDVSKRTKAIEDKIKELVRAAQQADSAIVAEVSEMFIGQTYVLFKYKVIKDVRLVYIPPRSIGEFGGETDNWIWPRHTGDFSFLRAYVAPDGSPAVYSENNIPFRPKRFLKVNPNGVDENDFVFILGYPGRTFRHRPAGYIKHHETVQLPYIANTFKKMIKKYEELGNDDPALALELSSQIKGLANTQKNYEGKILGLRRLSLAKKKFEEEKLLSDFINATPKLKEKFGTLLEQINNAYDEIISRGRLDFFVSMCGRFIPQFRAAESISKLRAELKKNDDEREDAFKENNLAKLLERGKQIYSDKIPLSVDKEIAKLLLGDAVEFPEVQKYSLFGSMNTKADMMNWVDQSFQSSQLVTPDGFEKIFNSVKNGEEVNDPFIEITQSLNSKYEPLKKRLDELNGKLNILLAQYLEVKKDWQKKQFIPDANSTLRMTYGYVRGYAPSDATYFSPITTLKGVIEKSSRGDEFTMPEKIRELYEKKDFGKFKNKKLNDIPVAILYNMDTTGGNSGSPIMNAFGELIGVNFDRAYEATINDYAWSEDYSRSIGVDIRYVLWIVEKYAGANYLLDELGVAG